MFSIQRLLPEINRVKQKNSTSFNFDSEIGLVLKVMTVLITWKRSLKY